MPPSTHSLFRRNNHPTSGHSVDPIAIAYRTLSAVVAQQMFATRESDGLVPENVSVDTSAGETSMLPVRHHVRSPFAGFGKRPPTGETGQESDSAREGCNAVPGLGRCEMGRDVASPLAVNLRQWA